MRHTIGIAQLFYLLVLAAAVQITRADEAAAVSGTSIAYQLATGGQVSLAVYDKQGHVLRELVRGEARAAGTYRATWDGLDRYGQALPAGEYQWRLLRTPGFQAEYLLSLGTNPTSAPYDPWVGNHSGPSAVQVDPTGALYVGAHCSENSPVLLRQSVDGRRMDWSTYQWDPMFGADAIAMSGKALLVFSINRTVRLLDPQSGEVLKKFDVPWPGTKVLNRKDLREDLENEDPPQTQAMKKAARIVIDPLAADLAGNATMFAVSEREHNAVRWFSVEDGRELWRVELPKPTGLAMTPQGETYVISGGRIVRLAGDAHAQPVEIIAAGRLKNPLRLALDLPSGDLFVSHGEPRPNQVSRISREGKVLATYGKAGGRGFGPYVAEDFYRIGGIAGDGQGGLLVTEAGDETFRRVAHFDAQGKLLNDWYGAQPWGSFVTFDPANPARASFDGGHEVRVFADMDVKARTYRVTHLFKAPDTDGLFPTLTHHAALWQVEHRNGQEYLVNAGGHVSGTAPAIWRVDEARGELIPMARAGILGFNQLDAPPAFWAKAVQRLGVAVNQRNFNQYAGYAWSDQNGNGRIDPEEITIGPVPAAGSYSALMLDAQWNVELAARFNGTQTPFMYAMPNEAAAGAAPRWTWAHATPSPVRLPAEWETLGKGQVARGIFRSADGSLYVFAKGNGHPTDDRQADTWPGNTGGAARLIKWHADGTYAWSVGLHASVNESAPGQFHDPMRILGETHDCIVVQDRVIRPAQVFTKDGLYAGYLLEGHVADALPVDIYATATAARQPGLLLHDQILGVLHETTTGEVWWNPSGRVSAPVFRIHGWDNWERQSGTVALLQPAPAAARQGHGLHAEYFAGQALGGPAAFSRCDTQLWFGNRTPSATRDTSGQPWITGQAPATFDLSKFSARWSGAVEAPYSEDFRFIIESEYGSTVRLWLDGRALVESAESEVAEVPAPGNRPRAQAATAGRTVRVASAPVRLVAGRYYALKLEYVGGGPAPQLHLEWESYSQERQHVPSALLYEKAPVATAADPAPPKP